MGFGSGYSHWRSGSARRWRPAELIRGHVWRFANARNRQRFVQNPDSYMPQFGGFCSFAVSKGVTANISPDAWHIEDDRLYLFADKKVRGEWVNNIDEGSMNDSVENWSKR